MAAIFALYFLRRPARKGDVMLRYLLVYGIFRAFVEQLRGDFERGTLLGLSTSTTIGIIMVLFSVSFLYLPPLVALRPAREPLPAAQPVAGGSPRA
jgi:prolipoprotein diacylglyceryltransferase